MPDVTNPIPVSSANRSSSSERKPKQAIKKIPGKVLKSFQRKPDRSQNHHYKTKYHNHNNHHHDCHNTTTTTTTSSTSNHYYHNHNHLTTSRVKVPKPKEGLRKEEERRGRPRKEQRRETTEVRIPGRREELRNTRREEVEEEQAGEVEVERQEEMNRLSLDSADVNSSLYYATDERFKINKPPASVPSSPLDHGDLSDLLSCPVCMEEYSTGGIGREPLFLSCHHSLCGQCLPQLVKTHHSKYSRDMSEVACPECRVVSLVPPGGLTQNFYLVSLLETRAATRTHRSTRLRMWCEICDSVALESCSTHPLTHLSTILQASTTTFTSTADRLSTILQSRSEEQGEAGRKLKEAVEVLDKASKSLRRRLVNRLDNATLAQATATSLLAEVDQMSRRVGCDLKISHEQSPRNRSKSPPMSHFTRAYSTPSSAVEGGKERSRGGKEEAGKEERRRLRKVRSDLTDHLNLNLESAYPKVANDPNWPEYLNESLPSPSSPVIPPPSSSLYIPPFSGSSTRTVNSFSPSVSSSVTPFDPCSSSSFPSSSTSPFSKRKTYCGISPSYFAPLMSSSLSSTPTSTPPSSPYLSSTSSTLCTFESLGSQEQEAKILLLKKCVETLGSMETTLMEGEERPKDKDGEGRNGKERADGERLENNREKSGVKEGVEKSDRNTRLTERVSRKEPVMRAEKFGSISKEMLLEMFKQALDALD